MKKVNTITNSTKIEMCCELAHDRVEDKERKLTSKGNGTTLIVENDRHTNYTDEGQDIFNEWYDYYCDKITSYLEEV